MNTNNANKTDILRLNEVKGYEHKEVKEGVDLDIYL